MLVSKAGILFGPYDILVVDPPWEYGNVQHADGQETSSAGRHYPTMPPHELAALDVPSVMAPDSLIYMWATGPQLEVAMWLLREWKSPFKTVGFVWEKERVNPGAYTMSSCEFVLVGKRGSIPKPRGTRNERQFLSEPRTTHSTKPEEIQTRIDRMHPGQRKLEMFARRRREGYDVFGNEVPT